MVIKTYFEKNNTIIFNSLLNTAKNPVTELFYGGEGNFSRFIFKIDETKLKNLYKTQVYPNLENLTHTLKMTNTGFFDHELLGKKTCDGKDRSTSFDLVVFKIPEFWDEGIGYDFNSCMEGDSAVISESPSNWFLSQTNIPWNVQGIYDENIEIIGTQHFDQGNENIEIDITNAVNEIISGNTTNYGFGIAFSEEFETIKTDNLQYVGFFTKHTQTFYEPYIETKYNCNIKDDRNVFYGDKLNRLYLYSNTNGNPTNLDYLPDVTITDCEGNILSSTDENIVIDTMYQDIQISGVTQCTKGVYYVDLLIPSNVVEYGVLLNDTWSNLSVNGITRPNVELSFEFKNSNEYYSIGDDSMLPKKVGLTVSGINHNESIKRGDIRKVFINTKKPYTINEKVYLDNLQYRLYVMEGKNEVTVIDYTDVEITHKHNYFLLDTESLLPNTYYLDIKYESNMEVNRLKEVLKFEITSQSRVRYSQ